MHYQLENQDFDVNERLQRELNESMLELQIEIKLLNIQNDLKKYVETIESNEYDILPNGNYMNKLQKKTIFNALIGVINDIKILRNEIFTHCGAIYQDEKINELIKMRKLQDHDLQIFNLLQELDTVNH